MSEKYVKDILEKLEEIEKLHAKLRSLVPRVKSHDAENISGMARKGSKNTNKQSKGNERDSFEQKLVDIDRNLDELKNTFEDSKDAKKSVFPDADRKKFMSKLRNRSVGNKWRKIRRDSVNFVTEHWHDTNDKIKNLLSNMNNDIILGKKSNIENKRS